MIDQGRVWHVAATVAVIAIAIASSGCKRNKPAPRTRIWLGQSHACSLQKAGVFECWGANDAGQLGDRTTSPHPLPTVVVNGATPSEVAIGLRHTCALYPGKAIKCWGDGARGQLGAGTTLPLSSPNLPVVFKGAPITDATAIAAGGDRSCALTPDGPRCWGSGSPDAEEPAGFHGNATVVAVGWGHVCAAFVDPRKVRCTGTDDKGQAAGDQPILAGATITALAAGEKHSCALFEDGSVQCWGDNASGQLGDGTTVSSRVPAIVSGLPPAADIRAGASHTCARLRNNTVACWGDNREHQLANGKTTPSSKPLPVTGLVGVVELAVGGNSACARLGDGAVRCWGSNNSGQLGDGTTTLHEVPMPVKSPRPASSAK